MSGDIKPINGTKKVIIVQLKFLNEPSYKYKPKEVSDAIQKMVNFYKYNSRNTFSFITRIQSVSLLYKGSNTAVINKAGPEVKKRYPGNDIYVLVSNFVTTNRSGAGFVYVKNLLVQTLEHECGHRIGLTHAGVFIYTGTGYTYDEYGDGLSSMSGFPSGCLTSPQYYYLGWTPASEIITIENKAQLPAKITLKRINNFSDNLASIIEIKSTLLKNPTGRDAFVSFPQRTKFFKNKPFVALHLRNADGGSAKVKSFASAFYDSIFTGLNMQIDPSSTADQLTITVSVIKPTSKYPVEVVPADDHEEL